MISDDYVPYEQAFAPDGRPLAWRRDRNPHLFPWDCTAKLRFGNARIPTTPRAGESEPIRTIAPLELCRRLRTIKHF